MKLLFFIRAIIFGESNKLSVKHFFIFSEEFWVCISFLELEPQVCESSLEVKFFFRVRASQKNLSRFRDDAQD